MKEHIAEPPERQAPSRFGPAAPVTESAAGGRGSPEDAVRGAPPAGEPSPLPKLDLQALDDAFRLRGLDGFVRVGADDMSQLRAVAGRADFAASFLTSDPRLGDEQWRAHVLVALGLMQGRLHLLTDDEMARLIERVMRLARVNRGVDGINEEFIVGEKWLERLGGNCRLLYGWIAHEIFHNVLMAKWPMLGALPFPRPRQLSALEELLSDMASLAFDQNVAWRTEINTAEELFSDIIRHAQEEAGTARPELRRFLPHLVAREKLQQLVTIGGLSRDWSRLLGAAVVLLNQQGHQQALLNDEEGALDRFIEWMIDSTTAPPTPGPATEAGTTAESGGRRGSPGAEGKGAPTLEATEQIGGVIQDDNRQRRDP